MEPGLRGHQGPADTGPGLSSQIEGQGSSTVTSRRVRMYVTLLFFFLLLRQGFEPVSRVQPGFELTV